MSGFARTIASLIDESESVDVGVWYRRYGEAVFRRCMRLAGDRARALDLTQEVFLRAHRFKDSYRGDASPLGWLFSITNRCFYDSLRKEERIDKRQLEAFLRDEQEGFEVAFSRHALVAKLLSRVPDDVRDIVVYRYFDELDLNEIASRLNVNERTVRRKLQRFFDDARKVLGRS